MFWYVRSIATDNVHETTLRSLVLLIQWYVLDYEIPYCMRMNRVRCGLRKHIRLATNCFNLEEEVFQPKPFLRKGSGHKLLDVVRSTEQLFRLLLCERALVFLRILNG